jgi:hypothetical protein
MTQGSSHGITVASAPAVRVSRVGLSTARLGHEPDPAFLFVEARWRGGPVCANHDRVHSTGMRSDAHLANMLPSR